ncbi:MAG TPA: bifunctional riboflavin kinase/FAD synthetase [Leptospiraceae bacterium]|nr:bifunctional riboflavin kinase/FAD synthetase [Leptospiraceae bacterium]HMW06387.1 bifunctional riboflavin kinase/FAD synthetase [Leptospiraceae bacterium]HMX31701.1 bifunctional riboflavin kinase/FAD synthetase [Leptospiraceae bacterium]HMY31987.1 bifunctional riboflavin kinase/FAD synthetase [Leptospiraceae bacterium]HMZ65800.1 bifunctional riboflavin kinase/FAD synthetase [Leptospiraceae bacterium]
MKVFNDIQEIEGNVPNGSVITLGNFDGIHIGHLSLIKRVKEVSKAKKLPSILVTYFPNPAIVLGKKKNLKSIYTEEIKRELIESFSLDMLLTIPFTHEFSTMHAYEFTKNILVDKLKPHHIIIGFNHFFGKDRQGDFAFLQSHAEEFDYSVEKIDQVYFNGEPVSSSNIRTYIQNGDIAKANSVLTRPVMIRGKVVKGFQRGRQIGFPTANIQLAGESLIPPDGVYSVFVVINQKKYKAMLNIGKNPTFENQDQSIEAHIFDFNEEIYGQTIDCHFIDRIRDEIKFSGIDALKEQLQKDAIAAKQSLQSR